jgi:hypothetical protein
MENNHFGGGMDQFIFDSEENRNGREEEGRGEGSFIHDHASLDQSIYNDHSFIDQWI